MSPPAAFSVHSIATLQRELLLINSRTNLAYRVRDAVPSVYAARILAANFCRISGSTRNSFPVPRRFNLAESGRQRKKRTTELPAGFRCRH